MGGGRFGGTCICLSLYLATWPLTHVLSVKALLIEDKERERKARRTGRNLCKLTVIRFSINVIVLSTLAGSAYAIYQAVRLSVQVCHVRFSYKKYLIKFTNEIIAKQT